MEKSVSDIATEYICNVSEFENDLRKRIIQALKSHGGEFVFHDDKEDEDDSELPNETIIYYGYLHPEDTSNVYSRLNGIKLRVDENDFIVLLDDGEQLGIECDIYGLVTICGFIKAILAEEN